MMLPPNPGDLDRMIRDHQEQLQNPGTRPAPQRNGSGLRVRIGHALIAAGYSLSGEQVDKPARHSALPHHA
jgi:hypothetical protein